MNFDNKLEPESLFPDLFPYKSNKYHFEAAGDSWIFNGMVDGFLEEKEDAQLRSIDQMSEPVEIKMDFINQDCLVGTQKDDELDLDGGCREDYEKLLGNPLREDYIPKESPKDIGAANFDEIIKIKAEYEIDNKDEDNITEIDLVGIEEDKYNEDTHENPKKMRKDVSYKTILRKCRKYYQQRFNAHTGFLRNKKKEPCSFYRDWILKFIEEWVPIKTNLNISFHMGALLYPQEMIKRIESFVYPNGIKNFTPKKVVKRKVDTHKQQVEKLHSILYKFTHEKLEKFTSVPELAAIFLNYIEQTGEKEEQDEDFKLHMKDLTKRCRKSIGKSRKTKSVVTLFD